MIEKPWCPECSDMGMSGRGCPVCGLKQPTEAAARQQRQIADLQAQLEALRGGSITSNGGKK